MSNIYPVWWDTSVTVYNKYEDVQTHVITWYRHTIEENCFWKDVGLKVNLRGQSLTLDTNTLICRIPKDEVFLEKYLWVAQPNDKMGNYFTLSQGDIIVKGLVDDVINEYTSGQRSTDLLKKYKALQGCMTIEEVGINVGDGRCDEHYVVRGT